MILYYSKNDKLIWQMQSISDDLDREILLQNLQSKNLIENIKNINLLLENSNQLKNKDRLEILINEIKTNLDNSKKIVADLTILKDITERLRNNIDQSANLNLYNSYAKACQENIYINKQNIDAINIKYAKELNESISKLIVNQKQKVSIKGQEYFVEIGNSNSENNSQSDTQVVNSEQTDDNIINNINNISDVQTNKKIDEPNIKKKKYNFFNIFRRRKKEEIVL